MIPIPSNPVAIPPRFTELVPPDEESVLEWLRKNVSRKMLEEIAGKDRGDQTREHFAALHEQLYSPKAALGLLAWNPREVLELERWNSPDLTSGHIKRLLATTILLRNAGHIADARSLSEEEFFVETSVATLIRFTESAIALGGELPYLSLKFLFWVYGSLGYAIIRPFTGFSAVLLMAVDWQRFQESDIAVACHWCVAVEECSRVILGTDIGSDTWLIGLSSYEDSEDRRNIWGDVATAVVRAGGQASVDRFCCLTDLAKRVGGHV